MAHRTVKALPRQTWNVYRNGRFIDRIEFPGEYDKVDVKNSLVNHDGYPDDIRVMKIHLRTDTCPLVRRQERKNGA